MNNKDRVWHLKNGEYADHETRIAMALLQDYTPKWDMKELGDLKQRFLCRHDGGRRNPPLSVNFVLKYPLRDPRRTN